MSDCTVSISLVEWYVHHSDLSRYVSDCTVSVSLVEWYVYHSDLSHYVSDCTISVSLRRVIHLSQWFITLCLWLYCISITSRVYHSDLSRYVSDCTVSVKESKKEVLFFIRLLLTTPYFHDIFLCKFHIHVSNLSTLYIENSVLVGSFWSLSM